MSKSRGVERRGVKKDGGNRRIEIERETRKV